MLLEDDKRELLVLARYRDMKYDQIADILGLEVVRRRTRASIGWNICAIRR
jgi:DNA-directed RNA polymerase specialized sigma24 family protein